MSSHHVIREKQEPALIIADMGAIPRALLDDLLEWSPTVICSVRSYENVVVEGIKVDVVFGNEPIELFQENTLFYLSSDSKTLPFIENAIAWLSENAYAATTVVSSEIEDESIPDIAERLTVIFLGKGYKRYRVGSGFQKWLAKGDRLRFGGYDGQLSINMEPTDTHATSGWVAPRDALYTFRFNAHGLILKEEL